MIGPSGTMFTGFNPRPRVEGDTNSLSFQNGTPMFQSAPSRGGRLQFLFGLLQLGGFNPRPRVEGDNLSPSMTNCSRVSIRALAWRAMPAEPIPASA